MWTSILARPDLLRRIMPACCFVVACITLSLGLWPFHVPANQVTWIPAGGGVEYGRAATILSEGPIVPHPPTSSTGAHSIEVWAAPHPYQKAAVLLSLYSVDRRSYIEISQALVDLKVAVKAKRDGFRTEDATFRWPEVFRRPKLLFLSITSGPSGVTVYADGKLLGRQPGMRIPEWILSGQLILGDSPYQPDSWRGKVKGLALYESELTADDVARHYHSWTTLGSPQPQPDEDIRALYLFGEAKGNRVHSETPYAADLWIPDRYMVVDKIFMEPFWEEFEWTRSYASAAVKNLIGFIPFGFCFYLMFLERGARRPMLLTVVSGMVGSLTIELLQWFLPTRDSGTTDIFTNTISTWVGAVVCSYALRRLLPWIAVKQNWNMTDHPISRFALAVQNGESRLSAERPH